MKGAYNSDQYIHCETREIQTFQKERKNEKRIMEEMTITKEEFEEKFDELIQELELQPGESIDINYMLGEHQEIGVRCEVWQNE